jgi:hypothetical protein
MSTKIPTIGSKAQVFHGNALHTSGGLFKKDLVQSRKTGRISSKKQVNVARKKLAQGKNNLGNFLMPKGKRGSKKMIHDCAVALGHYKH